MKGFTLIELIIVLTISMLVLTMSFVGVASFVKKQSMDDDALRVESELKKIHSMAVGVLNPNTTTCDNVSAYNVTLAADTANLSLIVTCDNGSSVDIGKRNIITNSKFEATVSFAVYPPKGTLSSAGGSVNIVLVNNNDSTLKKNLNYDENGVITISTL